MVAALSLLLVVVVSILMTRIATIALVHTGLSKEVARFQARSVFSGAGFTTSESERIVNHPVRRRIIMLLTLLGNAGMVTAVASLLLTFVGNTGPTPVGYRIALIAGGLVLLLYIANSPWVDRALFRTVESALRRYTYLNVRDYASVLHLTADYRIVEMQVTPESWLIGKTLAEAELSKEGILVLAVQKPDGSFIGAPRGQTSLGAEDTLFLYGRTERLEALDERKRDWRGDADHRAAKLETSSSTK
jgi:K+/H+ antiporter YhaU regulatory subunit KhtT